jgi:hypothetical protein
MNREILKGARRERDIDRGTKMTERQKDTEEQR